MRLGSTSKFALKFMKNKEQFYREITSREDLQSNCVLPVLEYFDGDTNSKYALAVKNNELLAAYNYMLVLPYSDKSLHDIILHDSLCGDWERIRVILYEICQCLTNMHLKKKMTVHALHG